MVICGHSSLSSNIDEGYLDIKLKILGGNLTLVHILILIIK
jgi:hypothetical protein